MEGPITPAKSASSPRLELAARLGRIAAICLVVEYFLYIIGPLLFFVCLAYLDPARGTGAELVSQISSSGMIASIAAVIGGVGFVVLASALAFLLLALAGREPRPSRAAMALGVAALVAVAAIPPAMVWEQAQARGVLGGVEAVTAMGGVGPAAFLLVAASLAYLGFALRMERDVKPVKLACYLWPVFAFVNLVGAAAIAGALASTSGDPGVDTLTLALALEVLVIPTFGVLAYRELLFRFPDWVRIDAKRPVPPPPGPERVVVKWLPLPPPPPPGG